MKKFLLFSLIISIFIGTLFQDMVYAISDDCYPPFEWYESDFPDSSYFEGTLQVVHTPQPQSGYTDFQYYTKTNSPAGRILEVRMYSYRYEEDALDDWDGRINKPTYGYKIWETTTQPDYASSVFFDPNPDEPYESGIIKKEPQDGYESLYLVVYYKKYNVVIRIGPADVGCDVCGLVSFESIYSDYWGAALEAMAMIDSKCGDGEETGDRTQGIISMLSQEDVIIPPDERFPARFSFSVIERDTNLILANEVLDISLVDKTINGRLEGDGQSGSSIQITSDTSGSAGFKYEYLGDPPTDAYEEVLINIKSDSLNIASSVKVKVGLKMKITSVGQVWDDRKELPRTLGLRINLQNAFDNSTDLLNLMEGYKVGYEVDIYSGYVAPAIKTKWLNEPDQAFLAHAQKLMESYPWNPEIDLYNDLGWFGKSNDNLFMTSEYISWQGDSISFQGYKLPIVIFKNRGLHVLELSLYPFFRKPGINDEFSELAFTADNIVKSAPSPSAYICADVYAEESVFQSAVCSFEPTNAQQFLLKTVLLDCPLVQAVPYVKAILTVQDVAGVICSFMQGDVAKVAETIGGKFISGIEDLHTDGLITLTESEKYLFKVKSWVESLKRVSDAGWSARTHFSSKQSDSSDSEPGVLNRALLESTDRNLLSLAASDVETDWPDSLDLSTMLKTVNDWSAGLFLNPTMAEHEAVVVMSSSKITVTSKPDGMVANEGDEVSVFMFPKKGGKLSFTADDKVYITNIQGISSSSAVLNEYELNADQQSVEIILEAGAGYISMDVDKNGSVDITIEPETTYYDSSSDSGCKINIKEIIVSGTREVGSPITFTMDAENSCSETIYYRYSVHPDYGTDGYDGLHWSSMTSTEYTTQNSIAYTFDKAGKYIVVVWAKNAASDSNTGVKIIGLEVEIGSQAELSSELTAYYPFNGNANDESGNGNNGIVYGAVLTFDKDGNANRAYRFDGIDDYIDIGNSSFFDMESQITISMWARPISGGPTISKWKTESFSEGSWCMVSNDQLTFMVSGDGSNGEYQANSGSIGNTDSFHHLVGVYDRSDNFIKVYVDGVESGTAKGQSGSVFVSNSKIYIGALNYNISSGPKSSYFEGVIDDIRIYNRALSLSEISDLYNETSSDCKIDINSLTVSGTREVGSPVAFTMDVDNSCSNTVYYRYSVHPDYGTYGYDGLNWSSMTSTEYTTQNSIAYTFDKPGKYIVVVWAKNAESDSNTGVKIIGSEVEINEQGEEPYFPF